MADMAAIKQGRVLFQLDEIGPVRSNCAISTGRYVRPFTTSSLSDFKPTSSIIERWLEGAEPEQYETEKLPGGATLGAGKDGVYEGETLSLTAAPIGLRLSANRLTSSAQGAVRDHLRTEWSHYASGAPSYLRTGDGVAGQLSAKGVNLCDETKASAPSLEARPSLLAVASRDDMGLMGIRLACDFYSASRLGITIGLDISDFAVLDPLANESNVRSESSPKGMIRFTPFDMTSTASVDLGGGRRLTVKSYGSSWDAAKVLKSALATLE